MGGEPAMSDPRLPLAGVKVLELGNYIAAPTCGRMLADLGATVIKVERPGRGDELRNWRLPEGTTSMLYRVINRNKRSIVLDLRSEQGRKVILDLASRADAIIENFRPGTLEKWNLGPDVLDAHNPEIILARISAFGQSGPLSPRPGFAAVAEAMSGFRELVGDPDRPPVRVGVSIGDSIAGMIAAFGVSTLLFKREEARRSNTPPAPMAERIIDVALNEAMFSVMESLVPDFSAYGVRRTRTGGRMQGIAPSNAYVCADGKSIVVAGNGDGIYARYMEAIGRPDLATRSDLQSNADRWQARDELDGAISAWSATLDQQAALAILDEAGVPAGPILTAEDLVEDEQLLARNMIQHHTVSTGERDIPNVAFPGITPIIGGTTSPHIRNLGPDLGQDTDAILRDVLGMSPEQISAFKKEME